MNVRRLFTDHPASVGESYLQHLLVAAGFGTRMVASGLACLLHAFLPFLFVRTGSRCIEQLHSEMLARRRHKPLEAARAQPSTWRGHEQAGTRPAVSQP
jgi:hypothetical protein